jgi:hypothetical protein
MRWPRSSTPVTHRRVLRRRREWFERMTEAFTALWWITRGTTPTTSEAERRVWDLRPGGPRRMRSHSACTSRRPARLTTWPVRVAKTGCAPPDPAARGRPGGVDSLQQPCQVRLAAVRVARDLGDHHRVGAQVQPVLPGSPEPGHHRPVIAVHGHQRAGAEDQRTHAAVSLAPSSRSARAISAAPLIR